MTNKLVVIINSLKVPKIKTLLLYAMKFLVPNYSCLQNPWLGGRGLPPLDPRSLSSVPNLICWTPSEQNSWVRHWLRTGFTVGQFLRKQRKAQGFLGQLSDHRVKKRACESHRWIVLRSIRSTPSQLHSLQQIPTQHDMLPQRTAYKTN